MIKQKQKGFTLVETMVAMVIVSIGLLAMASMLITGIKTNAASEHRMDAAATAQSLLLSARGFAGNRANNEASVQTAVNALLNADSRYKDNVTVTLNPSDTSATVGSYRSVKIQLSWNERGDTKSVALQSGEFVRL